MWICLLSGCLVCESGVGQVQISLQVFSLSENIVGTVYIEGESDSLLAKTDEDGTQTIYFT